MVPFLRPEALAGRTLLRRSMDAANPTTTLLRTTDYVRGLRRPGNAWRRFSAAVAALLVFAAVVFLLAGPIAVAVDAFVALPPLDPSNPAVTFGLWAGGNLLIALMIPVSGLLQWAVLGVRPGWLSSIAGRFRWRALGRAAAVVLPLWTVFSVLMLFLAPGAELTLSPATPWLVVVALLTIPLQAAGEEYLFRGLLLRTIGASFHRRALGLAAAVVVTSALFAVVHAPGHCGAPSTTPASAPVSPR